MSKSDDLANMEVMERTYTKSAFPEDTASTAFSSTCIYWKPLPSSYVGETDKAASASTTVEEKPDSTKAL